MFKDRTNECICVTQLSRLL